MGYERQRREVAHPAPPEDCRISINARGWAATPGCPFLGTGSAGVGQQRVRAQRAAGAARWSAPGVARTAGRYGLAFCGI
jgi:hypothetical protein